MSHSQPGEPPGDPLAEGLGEEEITGGFRRTRNGVSARFTAAQAAIVRSLVSQVAELIGGPEPAQGDAGKDAGPAPAAPAAQDVPSADDLAAMLGAVGPTAPPDDPVLARLFPDAYRDDEAAASEFRRYTEQDLRSGKVQAARTVLATLPARGGRIRLGADKAHAWLSALNDVRLALGVRLEITEDYYDDIAQADWSDPRMSYLAVYNWLSYLEESLVRALW